tara:strand:- start:81 stop:329 length:249 start_codon:yes stop_codon:yes gene_type:complete
MNLESKKVIKNLNDRLLTQNVIMQTIVEILLENGIVSESELEERIQENIDSTGEAINNLRKEESVIEIDEIEGLYYGPIGEA